MYYSKEISAGSTRMDGEHSAYRQVTNLRRLLEHLPLLLVALWVLLYWPTFEGLYARWVKWDEGMAHGFPVVALFLFLIYKSLPWIQRPVHPTVLWACTIGLAVASLAWFVFQVVNVTILEQLILLPILYLILLPFYGLSSLVNQRLLLLLPVFAIPVWDYLNAPLLAMSSYVVGTMVRLAGMPAVIEGNSIFIPYGHILIADGCSGLRYFVIALTLGYLVSYLNRYRERQLMVVLAVAAALGLITNWVRIFILIVIGYKTEMQSPLMADHEYFGWILFALVCLPAIYFAPVVKNVGAPDQAIGATTPYRLSVSLWFPLCAAAVGPLLPNYIDLNPPNSPVALVLTNLGEQHSSGSPMLLPVKAPPAKQTEFSSMPTEGVYIRVDHYQRQSTEEKLVPPIVRLYESALWIRDLHRKERIEGKTVSYTVFRHKSQGRRVAQLQWFNVGGHIATSVPEAKLWQVPAVLRGRNQFQITTLQANCHTTNCTESLVVLRQVATQLPTTVSK